MTSKTSALLILSALVALLSLGFASALALEVTGVSYSSTASHDSDVIVNFNVAYSGTVNFTTVNFSESYTNIGTWKTLPSPTLIANNSVPVPFSAVLNVPRYASGVINAVLRTKGSTSVNNTPITISITNAPALSISNIQSMTKTQNATINITNTGNTNLVNIGLTSSGDFNVSFSNNNIALSPGSSALVNVNALENFANIKLGSRTVTVQARDSATSASSSISYSLIKDFCDKGNINSSKVLISNIDDTSSDNAWEWKPLDDVTVEVEIENNLDRDEDFVVEMALYDTEKDKYVEIDGENSIEQQLSINEDDSETATFDFQVPSGVESSEGRYVLFVKAYVDGKEGTYCNSYAAQDVPSSEVDSIVINKDSHDVYLSEITSSSDIVKAGETVTISARAYNLGDNDESKVKVRLTNTKLGLELESSVFDLDMGDSNLVEFSFVVPYTAENGAYNLKLVSYFYYKKSSDSYSKTSDPFDVKITVAGGSTGTPSTAAAGIAASLESDAKAGSDMEVTATIKNLGSNRTTFIVGVNDYEDWASLNSISDRIVTLDGGQSKDIKISLKVNSNVSGEQTFTIESRAGDRVDSKEVAVEVSASSFFSSLSDALGGKTLIWIIGIINVVLIVLIIYLAVKIFSR